MGPGKVFTIKGCSLIRGVHYERFHCIAILVPTAITPDYQLFDGAVCIKYFLRSVRASFYLPYMDMFLGSTYSGWTSMALPSLGSIIVYVPYLAQ